MPSDSEHEKSGSRISTPTSMLIDRVHDLGKILTPTSTSELGTKRSRVEWPTFTLTWKQITESRDKEEVMRLVCALPDHPLKRMLREHLPFSKSYMLPLLFECRAKSLVGLTELPLGTAEVHYVITVSECYLYDKEVIESIAIILVKYKPEHCIIRCSEDSIIEAFNPTKGGTAHTLIAIGHGFKPDPSQIYSLGPYQAKYLKLAILFAGLIKKCNTMVNLKLLACYYGFVNPKFVDGLAEFNDHKSGHSVETGRMSATVLWNAVTQKVLPFSPKSLASLIWKRLITREKKLVNNFISLTASPSIINPVLKSPSLTSDRYRGYFIGCDTDHYRTTDADAMATSLPMWSETAESKISHTKSIRLVYMP